MIFMARGQTKREQNMNNIKSEEILSRAYLLDNVSPEHSYHKSYFHFINYFAGRNEITERDLVIGSNFTYGWMPTILNFKSADFELAVAALNRAKATTRISSADIMVLKGLINNSLVGVSKLLHFINPQVYAIWDSRVCNFLTGKSHKQKVENVERFWSYLDLCGRVTREPEFARIHTRFTNHIGYAISPMRIPEQIMFLSSHVPIRG
jgi:hypothetical protein